MSVEQNSIHWRERYYAARPAASLRVRTALSEVVTDIHNPITKLRFLRDVIDHQRPLRQSFGYRCIKPLNRTWLRLTTLWTDFIHIYKERVRTWVLRAVFAAVCAGITALTLNLQRLEYMIRTVAANNHAVDSKKAVVPAQPALAPVAETLPLDTLGVTPTTIWLADQGLNWELYSNGLRIETRYAVQGDPRSYRVHDVSMGLKNEVRTKPIGIVFHTSESDVWPLDTDFNKQLRQSSEALLSYVKRKQAYNYVIDRFGRVFRIVDDETRANHAGHGVWANGDEVYLDINSAFLGVSFESRWEGGRTMPITRAQLIAGRNLTHYLRQRFAIAPEMSVTHGLTSVSPKQHLIGFHLDWARGFPFAAFGLPDQYAVTPPSMKLFGFSYNADLIRTVGNDWPGALAGKAAFATMAAERGVSVEALRAERKALYLHWLDEARASADSVEQAATDVASENVETHSHSPPDTARTHSSRSNLTRSSSVPNTPRG